MSQAHSNKVTFQITVDQLNLLSPLPKQDIRVTITVDDLSKTTCVGKQSKESLTIIWDHPFLFTVPPSTSVGIAIYAFPELAPGWDKEPIGDQVVTNVADLLESSNLWQCNIPGLSNGSGTLSMKCKTCVTLAVPEGHDCLPALTKYDMQLYHFGQDFKNLPCQSTQIEMGLSRLDLCPLGHTNHTIILNDIAASFQRRYGQWGNISDLNKAIEIHETRLKLCPLGHPEHAQALGHLATSLGKYYMIQRNEADLDRIIEMQERVLVMCPPGHSNHAKILGRLAISLKRRYNIQKCAEDLSRAIEMEENRLGLCPPGHSYYAEALGNLALSLGLRFRVKGDLTDLNKSIDLQEKKLELRPPGHRSHGLALQNLAFSLQDHFNATKVHSDLIRAIQLFKKALVIHPVQHYRFATVVDALAEATLLLSSSPPPGQPSLSLDEAFETYRQLNRCGPAASFSLLDAAQNWIQHAEKRSHSSVLEAYQVSLDALDHFTSLNSSLESRHETMQARVVDLANDAFSCAIRYDNFKMAVELLEQSRGILWNQLARFDISIAVLENRGDRERALGDKFMRLSTELREHAQGDGGSNAYWRTKDEWQSVVDAIRCLDGLSRFLLPPLFEDLQQAAELGPIIVVNASKYDCDALIILRNRHPVHVLLPCSLPDVDQLCSQLSKLTQNAYAFGSGRESWVKALLAELWSTVVEPIASVLQRDIRLSLGSRIWWCPTSKFTKLPFHAAGPYRKGENNMFDLYVSSYAPSLSALVRAHDRVRAQRAARDASGITDPISFAAVGQRRPSVDIKLGELPEVDREIDKIRDEAGIPPEVVFNIISGDAATIDGAVRAFHDYRWVHLACHGSQHARKPFDSWFAMGDGRLTLMRIIQERYANSEFAFLSACHTAVGDASTPDEVLHLAAGMQFAGFNGVIGTLWRVDDAVTHKVATQFYKEMFKKPVVGFENAAAALNAAIVETADEVSLEKRIVFVHIGI